VKAALTTHPEIGEELLLLEAAAASPQTFKASAADLPSAKVTNAYGLTLLFFFSGAWFLLSSSTDCFKEPCRVMLTTEPN
jgi:hypothetical protein